MQKKIYWNIIFTLKYTYLTKLSTMPCTYTFSLFFSKNLSGIRLQFIISAGNYITSSKLTIGTLEQRYEICSKLTIKTPKLTKLTYFTPLF